MCSSDLKALALMESEEATCFGGIPTHFVDLVNDPSLVNSAPYGDGWFYRIRLSDPAEASALLAPAGSFRCDIVTHAGNGLVLKGAGIAPDAHVALRHRKAARQHLGDRA